MNVSTYRTPQEQSSVRQGVATVTSIGAAVLLFVAAVLSVLAGVSAVAADELFVEGPEYIWQFSVTAWGWIHIILGALLAITAIALMTGAMWARITAVFMAGLSIIGHFMWIPYYPWWSIVVIALDIVVIWAVSTWHPAKG